MLSRLKLFFLLLMVAWITTPTRVLQAMAVLCEDVCTPSNCDADCWVQQSDFDNGWPATTCVDQGYSCCGDGICDGGTEGCNVCPEDCGTVDPSICETCTIDSCPEGYWCDPARHCTVASPPAPPVPCGPGSGCQGADVCVTGKNGEKACVPPYDNYCPDSPSCDTGCSTWCDPYNEYDMYCDPGIGRCAFVGYPDCVNADFSNACF